MDTIKYLLQFLFKFAIVMFFAAIVWFAAVKFNPGFSLRSLFYVFTSPNASLPKNSATSTMVASTGWLPAPGSFKGLFHAQPAPTGDATNVGYGTTFHGYDNTADGGQFDYVTYRQQGIEMAQGKSTSGQYQSNTQNQTNTQPSAAVQQNIAPSFAQKSAYLRSLSIYEGGHVYTGLSFTGEARNALFSNGRFPVIIVEQSTGRALAISFAEATTNWSTPGWVRFQVKMNTVSQSNAGACLMIFEQGRPQGSQLQPIRVAIPVQCN